MMKKTPKPRNSAHAAMNAINIGGESENPLAGVDVVGAAGAAGAGV